MAFDYVPKIVYTPAGGSPTTIEFDYPPPGYDSEGITVSSVGRVTEAASGKQQTLFLYSEEERAVTFEMITASLKDAFIVFMKTHALLGGAFDFYPHKTEAGSVVTVTLSRRGRSFKQPKIAPAERYRVSLLMRRVV